MPTLDELARNNRAAARAYGEQEYARGKADRQPEVDALKAEIARLAAEVDRLTKPPTPKPTMQPAQPALFAYGAMTPPAAWEQPGAVVVTSRVGESGAAFKRIAAAGGTVLAYLDAVMDGTRVNGGRGPWHDLLLGASVHGPEVGRWPGLTRPVNDHGWLVDFRPTSVIHKKLRPVLEQLYDTNPHLAGIMADDLGTRSWFPGLDWAAFPDKQAWYDGAVMLTQTMHDVSAERGKIVVVNGTWTGGTGNGGGYPDRNATGCALADGFLIENHDATAAYVRPWATATQWAGAGDPLVIAITATETGRRAWETSGLATHVAQQADYTTPVQPWGTFHRYA